MSRGIPPEISPRVMGRPPIALDHPTEARTILFQNTRGQELGFGRNSLARAVAPQAELLFPSIH